MEQTVHTNTDLNGKLTATQHRQVFHWILYRSEWFWAMMSSLSSEQVMSALWMVCVLCVCVRVCVWSGAGCPRVVAHSVPHPRLWMYSSETRRVQTMQDVFWAADVFHICTGVTWSRDITRTHQEGFNHTTTKQTTTNCIDLDLACSTLSLFFFLFFPLGFYSPFDLDIRASDKKGNPVFLLKRRLPPLKVKLGSATRQPRWVWRWRGVDLVR